MSGGSYNYTFYKLEEEYIGNVFDKELDDMLKDLIDVLHDLEWWQSSDYAENDYRETLKNFKNKWLKQYNKDNCYEYCKYKELASKIKQSFNNIETMEEENK